LIHFYKRKIGNLRGEIKLESALTPASLKHPQDV